MARAILNAMICREVARHLAMGDLDRQPRLVRWVLRFHVLICRSCRRYARQLRLLGAAFSRLIERRRQGADFEALRARFKAAVKHD